MSFVVPPYEAAGQPTPRADDAPVRDRTGRSPRHARRKTEHATTRRWDVEGLRAVAILLVACYHIWGDGRVSGGVDVFLMISGYFVCASLVRRISSGKQPKLGTYYLRLVRRLLPALVLTLIGVVAVTIFWLPRTEWSGVSEGVLASLTYSENWRMAIMGQQYAVADAFSSPVQHIWSLSVQGQIFFLMPLLLGGLAWLYRRKGKDSASQRRGLTIAVAVLAVLSFGYALYSVHVRQEFAYFDTGARAWEFLAGALVALLLGHRSMPAWIAVPAGWIGLAMLFAVGPLLDGRHGFPGALALVPVGAATLLMVAGQGQHVHHGSAARVLAWKPLSRSGNYAYEFYLWHWVVLVAVLAATGSSQLGLAWGLGVMLIAAALSLLGRRVADWWRARSEKHAAFFPHAWAPATALALAVVLVLPGGWLADRARSPWTGVSNLDTSRHPGALTLVDSATWPTRSGVSIVPDVLDAAQDTPRLGDFTIPCRPTGENSTDVHMCVLGDPDGTSTVAVVGGSHVEQLASPLNEVAKESGVRLEVYLKYGCPMYLPAVDADDSCAVWNREVLGEVVSSVASAVITTGTRPYKERFESDPVVALRGIGGDGDFVPRAYLEAWKWLVDRGVGVIAIRDNPWFPFLPPECVEQNGPDSDECSVERDEVLGVDELSPVLDSELFATIDLSDAFCEEDLCRAVVGNVLAYRDTNHLTATFSDTLALPLGRGLEQTPLWP